jgi:hypothetical protein
MSGVGGGTMILKIKIKATGKTKTIPIKAIKNRRAQGGLP